MSESTHNYCSYCHRIEKSDRHWTPDGSCWRRPSSWIIGPVELAVCCPITIWRWFRKAVGE